MVKLVVICFIAGVGLILASIVAGLVGLTGLAGLTTNLAWILFGVGVVLSLVQYFRSNRIERDTRIEPDTTSKPDTRIERDTRVDRP